MKKLYSVIMMAAVMSASCTKNQDIQPVAESLSFGATIEETAVKTTLGEGGKTLWEASDQISIYNGTANAAFSLTSGAGTNSAVFTGTLASAEKYYAFYPISAMTNEWKISTAGDPTSYFVVPGTQTAVKGQFPIDAMAAVSTNTGAFAFKHLNSALRFTIDASSPKIKSIKITSDAVIAGKWSINYNTMDLSNVSGASNQLKEITYSTADGSAFEIGDYYISVAAKKLNSASLSFAFVSVDDKVAIVNVTEGKTAEAGKYYNLGTVRVSFNDTESYALGDIYPKTGAAEGIVCELGTGTIKILSIDEASKTWCATTAAGASTHVGMKDNTNGKANCDAIVKAEDYSAENYPAVAWCVAKGEGWYLPSGAEIKTAITNLGLSTDAGVAAVNEKINAAGGNAIAASTSFRFWTSTETTSDATKAYYGYYSASKGVATTNGAKTGARGTRAMKQVTL